MGEEFLEAGALDDPFEGDTNPTEPAPEPGLEPPANPEPTQSDDSFITDLLAANGIEDASKIKFEEEDGTVVERAWKDLSREEKLNILSPVETVESSDYSEEEVNLIQKIREAQQSPDEYLEALKEEAAQAVQPVSSYEIDAISDDELFVLDAIDKYGEENVSDEQLEELLKNAKSNPELYEKTIESLRAQYKQREDELNYQKQQESEAQQEEDFKNFSASVLKEIESLDTIGGQSIELSIEDMNDIANYILTRDEEGNSEFGKVMNDPKKFVELAFWALKGNDIMSEISSQLKTAYEKGVEAGKKGQSQLTFTNPKDKPSAHNVASASALFNDVE